MISGGYRCPLYDDDAAVTTTDLGSDQATHQLDSAPERAPVRSADRTLAEGTFIGAQSIWSARPRSIGSFDEAATDGCASRGDR